MGAYQRRSLPYLNQHILHLLIYILQWDVSKLGQLSQSMPSAFRAAYGAYCTALTFRPPEGEGISIGNRG